VEGAEAALVGLNSIAVSHPQSDIDHKRMLRDNKAAPNRAANECNSTGISVQGSKSTPKLPAHEICTVTFDP
jgi:hypothetical protein